MKKGDVVFLNSGSPELTVVDVDFEKITVSWYVKGELQKASFPTACLTEVFVSQ